jgi:gamma-glutamyltranspeptidase / glutathione hydrolase
VTFPSSCVVSSHHLASAIGLEVLASGGNAMDAAVATNLALGVVTPYLCGFGGDLFALVWREGLTAYNGSGRAPAAATVEAVRAAVSADHMPQFGPLTVTVPGAVAGWFDLLDRFGSRPFGELARPALGLAGDGFAPSERSVAGYFEPAKTLHPESSGWRQVYGGTVAGGTLVQPGLARAIEALCREGPDAYYRGPIAVAIAERIQAEGGLMAREDLAGHRGGWVTPLSAAYLDTEVVELPPNTQGVTALEALAILDGIRPLPPEGADRNHLMIEAMKLALADRNEHVTDPDHMRIDPGALISKAWVDARRAVIDPERACAPRSTGAAVGGTAYLCAADADGMLVSLIQSNYEGFGSRVTVPEWGINLHNRGALFSLNPAHVNAIAPRKRTLHTLIPTMALRGGRPWLVFGTMGGDGQAQTHLQLLVRIVNDGEDPQSAIDAPRWRVSAADWTVTAESRLGGSAIDDLRRRGQSVTVVGKYDSRMGHAHAIEVRPDGYAAGTDPRTEGSAMGL